MMDGTTPSNAAVESGAEQLKIVSPNCLDVETKQCMDANGSLLSRCSCEDEEVINIIDRGHQHFEPVLHPRSTASNQFLEEIRKDKDHEKIMEAIQSNNILGLKASLQLFPKWTIDNLKSFAGFKGDLFPMVCEKFQIQGPLSYEMHYFLEEEFALLQLCASMSNLSKKFVNENELLDAVCTSLQYFTKYAQYFLMKNGVNHHRLNHAFFLLVAEKYENWMEIRNAVSEQLLKSIPRELLKEIQMFLTKVLFPLGEYSKALSMNDLLRQMRLDFLKVSEKPMQYLQITHDNNACFDEMEKIKSLYQTYRFGEYQFNLANKLYAAFVKANKQTELIAKHQVVKDEQYSIMKDIYVLERILNYISMALSMKIKAEELTDVDKLVLERVLQVTGEYVKNTKDAPNLSDEVGAKLKETGVKVESLTELRNLLSHYSTKQAFSELNNKDMDILLGNIRTDLQKVRKVVAKLIRQLKIRQIQGVLNENSMKDSSSKTDNEEVIKQIRDALDDVKRGTPSQDMKVSFDVMLNILKKHSDEQLGDIRTSVQEILFVILPEVILEPLKTQDKEIWINSALFKKIANSDEWLDSNSVITKISSLKQIEKYKQTKLGKADDSVSTYGVTFTELFVMVLVENAFSNKVFKKKCKYGFQEDLTKDMLENLGMKNMFLQLFYNIAIDQLNLSLEEFLNGSSSSENLFTLMKVEESRGKDFQKILDEFKVQFTRMSKPIEVLDNILETVVSVIEHQLIEADLKQLKMKLKNKKETHIAKTRLAILCSGIKKVPKVTFDQLVGSLHSDIDKKKMDEYYLNRRSCKTVIDRVKDSYGSLLDATGMDLKGMKKYFNIFTDSLKDVPDRVKNILKKTIERVIEEHFESQFQNSIKIIKNLRQEMKQRDEEGLETDALSHFLNKKRMMTALEMALLKATNIIGAISTPEIFKRLEKLMHLTMARCLQNFPDHFSVRNYLAHGDAIIEMRNENLVEYLNGVADFLVEHGDAIMAINKIMNDSKTRSILLTFLSVHSLNQTFDQNPALYGRDMEILKHSNFWKNQSLRMDLTHLLVEDEKNEKLIMASNFNIHHFIEIIHQETCSSASFGDFKSIQFFLDRGFLSPERLNLLHFAAESGSSEVIRHLLQRGFEINAKNEMNCTPLQVAVLNRRIEACKILLNNKADVGAKDNNGYTPLHAAAYLGITDLITLLIDHGAKVQELNAFDVSPLLLATLYCHYDATVALLDNGALVNASCDLHMTPLFCAAARGQCDIIELLLNRDADIEGHPNCDWTPLQVATTTKYREAVQLLLQRGAKVNSRSVHTITALHYVETLDIAEDLLSAKADVNCWSKFGTPLHTTAREGYTEVVRLLLQRGANKDAVNEEGFTAMHYTAFQGDVETTRSLIEAGASVDIAADSIAANKYKGVTPLHLACSNRQPKTVLLLLQHGANVNAICFQWETDKNRYQTGWSLKSAIEKANLEIVDLLFEHSADVNIKDDLDLTALHHASIKGLPRVVEELLVRGADVNALTKGMMTPIYFATVYGFCDIIQLLMNRGADIRHKVRGETLLHVAVQQGRLNAAKLLLESGLRVNAKGVHSKTALHWACAVYEHKNENAPAMNEKSKLEMVRMLLENKADPNAVNFCHDTPLHLAASNGYIALVEALLEFGGNAHARNLALNVANLAVTPLEAAKRNGHVECYQLMKGWGSQTADLRTENDNIKTSTCIDELPASAENWISELCKAVILSEGENVVDKLLAQKDTFGNVDLNDYQLLHICAAKNDLTMMKKLKDHGLDIDRLGIEGTSPLHLAVQIKCHEAVQSLLRFGADVNILTKSNEQSALHLAVQNEDIDMVRMLLDRDDVEVQFKNTNGETPLILACQNGSSDIVNALIRRKVQIDQNDGQNQDAAIHAAVKNNRASVVETLLNNDANPRAAGKVGNHPLHYCVQNGNLDIARMLIDKGETVNCCNDKKYTPLHVAAKRGDERMVEFLLLQGANVDGVATDTDTPLHFAVTMGHSDIVEKLMEKKPNVNATNGKKQTALHFAAAKGEYGIVERLLQSGARVVISDHRGCTPLFLSIKYVHISITELLLGKSASVNAVCQEGWAIIHEAVRTLDVALVKMILDKGADIDCSGKNRWTPLHTATSVDSLAIVDLLIDRKAKVNLPDVTMERPIHIACYYGYYDVAEKLIAAGADVNCFSVEDLTPLYMAVEQDRRDIIRLLLANNADIDLISPITHGRAMDAAILNMDFEMVKFLIDEGADVKKTLDGGISFMHRAACYGSKDILEVLASTGADVHVRMDDDATPFHAAVERGHLNCVQFLLQAGADINLKQKVDYQPPPLSVAIQNEHEDVAKALVEMGADVNLTDIDGHSPLMYAIQKHMPEVVLRLIAKGAKVNATNEKSLTALHLAIVSKDFESVQHLLKNGANIEVLIDDGQSLLHFAIVNGDDEIFQLLLDPSIINPIKLPINIKTTNGMTPLHQASRLGLFSKTAILLANGADVNVTNKLGRTPLHLAVIGESEHRNHGDEKTQRRTSFLQTTRHLISKGAIVDAPDKTGLTPLCMAAYFGSTVTAQTLLQNGANPTILTKTSSSSVHMAALGGHVAILKLVLEQLPDVAKSIDAQDQDGYTPLMRAAGKRMETAELLLMMGADVNIVNKSKCSVLGIAANVGFKSLVSILLDYGSAVNEGALDTTLTPLYHAASQGHADIVEILLNNGAKVDQKDNSGSSVLHRAARKGHLKVVEILLKHGASAEEERSKDSTVLHAATHGGNAAIVQLIVNHLKTESEYEKYLNARDSAGDTPLMIAAKMGHLEAAEVLLRYKVDDSIRNEIGVNALEWAVQNGHRDVVELLENYKR